MTTATENGINQESQENTFRVEKKVPALTAPSTGAIEQDGNPAGADCADRAGRSKITNCTRKSRNMQEVLGRMTGAWTA
jgi:hypothetical protein